MTCYPNLEAGKFLILNPKKAVKRIAYKVKCMLGQIFCSSVEHLAMLITLHEKKNWQM